MVGGVVGAVVGEAMVGEAGVEEVDEEAGLAAVGPEAAVAGVGVAEDGGAECGEVVALTRMEQEAEGG